MLVLHCWPEAADDSMLEEEEQEEEHGSSTFVVVALALNENKAADRNSYAMLLGTWRLTGGGVNVAWRRARSPAWLGCWR